VAADAPIELLGLAIPAQPNTAIFLSNLSTYK
jgi:hypothetical protein